ncbi:MAG: hypothetical protein AB1393_14255 [Candidatus Edwardsbacteria bacterium]
MAEKYLYIAKQVAEELRKIDEQLVFLERKIEGYLRELHEENNV